MPASRLAARRCFSASSKHVPIAIVGGGPSGLLLSNLLSTYNTPSLLLEARAPDQLFRHPQAHFMNTRTMEILRHSLPDLYIKTRDAMPPVEEWRYFSFGYDAVRPIARVVHPVDQPVGATGDANGVLLATSEIKASPTPPPDDPLSVCSVGHLAQHTFSKLLYESAMDLRTPESELQLESPVVDVKWIEEQQLYKLTTNAGEIFYAPIVVAADGSNSRIRQKWKIDMIGQKGIQHLINVHVRASIVDLPPAMLYAIYNDDCVAMMVRHSENEFVLQIPYFPPYQTMEKHFAPDRVHEMMTKIMNTTALDILSIRPWTMSSQIASSYVDPRTESGVLLGDAAHTFPPAGGFGMNTGLQDAHNLAWRLAAHHHNDEAPRRHLRQYQDERQPIARNNAALSVRNFTRVLNLAKSCYLNDQHPQLLIRMLDNLPLVPLEMKQDMFQGLLSTALSPLAGLKQATSWHAKHVTSNLRAILEQGGGLPLLFPKFELGFGYTSAVVGNDPPDWKADTLGYSPKVKAGYLLPHVEVKVLSGYEQYPNLQFVGENSIITMSDLPSQMRRSQPTFVALVVGDQLELKDVVGIESALVVEKPPHPFLEGDAKRLVLQDKTGKLFRMFSSGIILIRSDGHVVCTATSWDELQQRLPSHLVDA